MKQLAKRVGKSTFILLSLLTMSFSNLFLMANIHAEEKTEQGFSMTPMKEEIIVNPGEAYHGSFTIFNPAGNTKDFPYNISIRPFYVDENYNTVFDQQNEYSQMAEWTTIDSPLQGSLKPNERVDINYTINAPTNAPAGGQYLAIIVTSNDDTAVNSTIVEKTAIAHTIFGEVTGQTEHKGEIVETSVPGLLLSGDIYGDAIIKNTGNVHDTATYTLQVFPLFSNEEVFTNVETPDTHIILPNRSFYNKTKWANTPNVGIFNVKYTVEFEGVKKEITKLVIVCPIWLILVIIIAIIAIITCIVLFVRKKKTNK